METTENSKLLCITYKLYMYLLYVRIEFECSSIMVIFVEGRPRTPLPALHAICLKQDLWDSTQDKLLTSSASMVNG